MYKCSIIKYPDSTLLNLNIIKELALYWDAGDSSLVTTSNVVIKLVKNI